MRHSLTRSARWSGVGYRRGLRSECPSEWKRFGKSWRGDLAEHVASNLDPEHTNSQLGLDGIFVKQVRSAPALLELVNGCDNPAGRDWLKDLLRRLMSPRTLG